MSQKSTTVIGKAINPKADTVREKLITVDPSKAKEVERIAQEIKDAQSKVEELTKESHSIIMPRVEIIGYMEEIINNIVKGIPTLNRLRCQFSSCRANTNKNKGVKIMLPTASPNHQLTPASNTPSF